MTKLKIKDLHPRLQTVYTTGCEIEHAMRGAIRREDGAERTAIGITNGMEENYEKPIRRMIFDPLHRKEVERTVGYEREFTWQVRVGYTSRETDFRDCLSFTLSGGRDAEANILAQTQRIARELKEIYKLPYDVTILRDGRAIT